jgi:hypothetical protein
MTGKIFFLFKIEISELLEHFAVAELRKLKFIIRSRLVSAIVVF